MWTISDFLFFGNYLGASLSSLHSCSASQLRANGALANSWKESARPVLGGPLFNFTLFSSSPSFFPLAISTCSQKCAPSKRQIGRVRGQSRLEMVRWGSAALPEPGLLLFLLTSWHLSKDSFFYKYCLSLKELQRILFLKGLHGKQILASSYFKGGQRERPKSTFKLLHTMLYIHNPIFPSSSSG